MILDSHVHIGHGDGLSGPWDTYASLRSYLTQADRAGITHSVLFAPLTSDYRRANREVAQQISLSRRPGRFVGFAFVNPVSDRGRIADMVSHAVDTWGFRGIKVHWSDGRITREIAEVARARRLPVIYDPRGDTASVEMIASSYPDVAWIIPHLSSFADDWKAQLAFVDQLARLPNVFTDTSGVRYFDLLADAVRRAGAHKVLFGTDGPFLSAEAELAKVRALRLAPTASALVLGGNAVRLMRGVRRAGRPGLSRRPGQAGSPSPPCRPSPPSTG